MVSRSTWGLVTGISDGSRWLHPGSSGTGLKEYLRVRASIIIKFRGIKDRSKFMEHGLHGASI